MVNTRILEQQHGWRRSQDGDDEPRGLRHEPLLQGRVQSGERLEALPAAPGLALRGQPVGRLGRAGREDAWAALEPLGESLEAVAARHGALPPLGRDSAAGATLDLLRSALLRTASQHGWRRIGISAPRRGAGASFVALGLAAAVARLNYLRVVLVDLDLAQPSLHRHLGLTGPGPLEAALRGQAGLLTQAGRMGANLALVLNDTSAHAPADLLHSPDAILALRSLSRALAPDLMLVDLPPLLTDPAAAAGLAQVEAVLLVADGTATTARDIIECERRIEGQTPLLGVVLNKSEDRPGPAAAG